MTTYLTRIEYLTRDGWVTGHKGIGLLNPQRYVDRLAERGKWGRATVLDENLQPAQVFEPPNLPKLSDLRPDPPYQAHVLKAECKYCLGTLCDDDDMEGTCLL